MGGVFVNYRTGDGDWAATLIARELATRFGPDEVFLASKSIRPGEDFAERIETRLRECDVLLVVVGPQWWVIPDRAGRPRVHDPHDWVNREVAVALEHGLRVIPVLLDGVARLAESDLPAAVAALGRCQYLRLHHRNDDRDIARLLDELTELVPGVQQPRPAAGPEPADEPAQCPYRGLQAFREEDAAVFHGRDREIARLGRLVAHRPVVVVAGASGSGKSSLVRAGLWPLLRREGATTAVFRPIAGIAPRTLLVHALRTALGPAWHDRLDGAADDLALLADPIAEAAGELVLCVDQFEELAGTDPGAAAELFGLVVRLVEAAPPRPGRPPAVRAVFTMRSAAVDGMLTPELAAVLEESAVYVNAMGPDQLRAAITGPLAGTGSTAFEPGLVERIVTDAGAAPGQLPLVEFALTRLWESRRDGVLTHEAYDAMGGVGGALAGYAEEFYAERLSAAQRPLVQRLLVQLARPAEDGSFRLAPVPLERLPAELHGPATELGRSRLVVIRQDVDQPEVVALAHEALVLAWGRLHGWLVAAQEFRSWQERLRGSLDQWRAAERDSGGLLRGASLAAAEQWLTTEPDDLSATEREYIAASRRHQLRGVRRWRLVTALVAALAVAATVLAVVAAQSSGELADQLHDANATLIAQESRRVAEESPSTSLQLALAAWRERPGNPGAYEALLAEYLRWHSTDRVLPPDPDGALHEPQASADGRVTAMLVGGGTDISRVVLWDDSAERSRRWVPTERPASTFALSPDGRLLAISTSDGEVLLWTVADRAGPFPLRDAAAGGWLVRMRFDAGSRYLAAIVEQRRVEVWDAQERRALPSALDSARSLHTAVPLPGGNAVLTHEGVQTAGTVLVRDRATGRELAAFGKGSTVVGSGAAVVVCEPAGLRIRDPATGADRTPSPAPPPCDGGTPPTTDATGQFLCIASYCGADGRATLLHWPTGRRYTVRTTLQTESDTVGAVGVLDLDGGLTVVAHDGDTLARARAAGPDPAEPAHRSPSTTAAAFDPVHRRWLTSHEDTALVLTDAATGRPLAELADQLDLANLAFTPDGARALGAVPGELRVYRTPALEPERVIRVPDPPPTGRAQVVALSPGEVAFRQGGVVTRWDLDTGQQIGAPLPLGDGDQVEIHARPAHPGQIVAETAAGLEVWDLPSATRIGLLPGEPPTAGSPTLVMDPTGTHLAAVARSSGRVDVWDVDAGRALPPVPSPQLSVVGFMGPLLLLIDASGEFQLWRWEQAQLVATIDLQSAFVGRQLVGDELVYLALGPAGREPGALRFDPQEWFTRLCAVADREFTPREAERLPATVPRQRPCLPPGRA